MDVAATSMLVSCHTHPMDNLNTSDHLPITVSLVCDASESNGSSQTCKRIDWAEDERSGALNLFTSEVQARLQPLLIGPGKYDIVEEISREVEQVTRLLTTSAEELLSSAKTRMKPKFRSQSFGMIL